MSKIKFYMMIITTILLFVSCSEDGDTTIIEEIKPVEFVEITQSPGNEEDGSSQQEVTGKVQNTMPDYNITLDINNETNMVKGVLKVVYYNRSRDDLNQVCFNLHLNAFKMDIGYQPYFTAFRDKIFGKDQDKDYGYINVSTVYVDGEEAVFEAEDTDLAVFLKENLSPDKYIEITLQFEAYIPKINHRTGSNDNAMWLGNFLPILAVYEDGAFRNDIYHKAGDPFYSETSNYTVSVNTAKGYKAIAPGKSVVKEDDENKTRTTTFTAKNIREFSLAILNISSYGEISKTTSNGVKITMYYCSELEDVDSTVQNAKAAMEYYNDYIGEYPYDSFNIVETGMFLNGGTEFSQMTFVDGAYLRTHTAGKTISHEIAHQWFYNVIGNDQIREPWLDEALASFIQEKMSYNDNDTLRRRMISDYERLEMNPTGHLLTDDISMYKSWEDYYATQYTRGKLMIFDLYLVMGEETFEKFIKEYYIKYAYKIVKTEDFISTAEEVYGYNLTEFFNSWLLNEKMPQLKDAAFREIEDE